MGTRFVVAAVLVALAIGVAAIFSGGGDDDNASSSDTTGTTAASDTTVAAGVLPEGCNENVPPPVENRPTFTEPPPMTIDPAKTYAATLTTSCGDITIALDAKNAPNSVNNFVFLAKSGFYDGIQWPRAAAGFVIQTGSPDNTQAGGPGYSLVTEVPAQPGYAEGAVAWAKGGQEPAGTAGSQFFVVTGEGGASLPADYGTIGTVTDGLANAQKIASLAPNGGDGPPTIPMYLLSVAISET